MAEEKDIEKAVTDLERYMSETPREKWVSYLRDAERRAQHRGDGNARSILKILDEDRELARNPPPLSEEQRLLHEKIIEQLQREREDHNR